MITLTLLLHLMIKMYPLIVLIMSRYFKRENLGYDFGAWSYGLYTDDLYKNYDTFIFVNSSVVGPFLPFYFDGKWSDIFLKGLNNNVSLYKRIRDYKTAYGVIPFKIHVMWAVPEKVLHKRANFALLTEGIIHKSLHAECAMMDENYKQNGEWFYDS